MYAFDRGTLNPRSDTEVDNVPVEVDSKKEITRRGYGRAYPERKRSTLVIQTMQTIQKSFDAAIALMHAEGEIDRAELLVTLLRVGMTAQQIVNLTNQAQEDILRQED